MGIMKQSKNDTNVGSESSENMKKNENRVASIVKQYEERATCSEKPPVTPEKKSNHVNMIARQLERTITTNHILNAKYADQKIEIKQELKRMREMEEEKQVMEVEIEECEEETDSHVTDDLEEIENM